MEENIMEQVNTRFLMGMALKWAYKNDGILYHNILHGYERFSIEVNYNDKKEMEIVKHIEDNYTIEEILKMAAEKADFSDCVTLGQVFIYNHLWSPIGIYDWKYEAGKENPFSFMPDVIRTRMKYLETKGYKWHRSTDHKKHSHFRWWIKHFLENEDNSIHQMHLLVANDTRCFDALHVGNNYSSDVNLFNTILQYILDKDICPDPHNKTLEVPDFIEKYNMYNTRKITTSGVEGGFWYLVYLTAEELQDIYKTRINKTKLNQFEKCLFGFINAIRKDQYKDMKFFIYIK